MGESNLIDYAKYLTEDIPEKIAQIHAHFTIEISIVMKKPRGHFSRAPEVIWDLLNEFGGGTFFQAKGYWQQHQEPVIYIMISLTGKVGETINKLKNKIKILAFSKINSKSPTIYECKRILKDFINYNNKSVNVESIQNIVASYFNLSLQEMLSQRRSRSLARPRQIAMYLSKQHTTNSLPDIGRKFSNRDHTTVIHAVKKIEELMKKDNEIRLSVTEIRKRLQ